MKIQKLSLFVLFLGLGFTVNCQISLGLRTAYVNAWMDYGDVELPDDAEIDVDGYQVSALIYHPLNKHFQIGLEPGYVQRGAACVPGFTDFNPFETETKFFINYLELPVMVSGRFPFCKNKLELFGKIGVGASTAISGRQEETQIGSDLPPVETDLDIRNDSRLQPWGAGFYSGLGLAYYIGPGNLFLESNYYNGFLDVDTRNISKNRSIQIGIGYSIML